MKRQMMLIGLTALLAGCTSYYRVTDQSSGKTYLSTSDSFHVEGGNRVATFRDEVSKTNVTLNHYEYRQMSKDEYDRDLAARQAMMPVSPK